MSETKLVAETRTEFGKGAARRIRRDHKIPAVMYGHGTEPVHITLPGHDTMMALKARQRPARPSTIDGKSQLALAKDVQRDPIKPVIEHVDLVVVRRGEKVTVDVPRPHRGRGRRRDRRHRRAPDRRSSRSRPPTSPRASRSPSRASRPAPRSTPSDLDAARGRRRWSPTPRPSSSTSPQAITAEALEAELAEAEAEAGIEHEAPQAETEGCRGPAAAAEGTDEGLSRPPRSARSSACLDPWPSTDSPGWSSGWATPARRTPATGTTSAPWSSTSWPPAPVRACARTRRGPSRAEVRLGVLPGGAPGPQAVVATPLSYMNESGGPVAGADAASTRSPSSGSIVVHDELDIPFGTVRLKRGGGEGGHNGLRSISASARHQGLPPGAGRHRPAAGPDGPGRLRAARTSPRPSARSCRSCCRTAPTPSSASSLSASRPRSRTSIRANFF